MKIEYKVRPVTRFVVTKYSEGIPVDGCAQSECKGEFDNPVVAYQVAYALAKEDQSRHGFDLGDERIIFPNAVIYQSERKWDAQMPVGIGSGSIED